MRSLRRLRLSFLFGGCPTHMNRLAALVVCGLSVFLTGCAKPEVRPFDTSDPIDRVVEKESASRIFPSGPFQPIRLPPTASIALVTSNALIYEGLAIKPVKKFTIVGTREVLIHEDKYTAVRVITSSREMVVLLRFQENTNFPQFAGWWSRVYDGK